MLTFCIPKNLVDGFLKRLQSGEIDLEKLALVSSEQRRNTFSELFGEKNAKEINALYESKLLLKDQQSGLISWIKKISGLSEVNRKDMVSRVEKMTEVLTPENSDAFLEDIVAKRLGTRVTMEQATEIVRLAKETTEAKSKVDRNSEDGSPTRLEYGRKQYDFNKYFGGLKTAAEGMRLRDYLNPDNWGKAIYNIAGITKSLAATFDDSVIGRQGYKVLTNHPEIWKKNSLQTFVDIYKTFKGEDIFREIAADVLSRENALNGAYKEGHLAVGTRAEESFPEPISLPGSNIPVAGEAIKIANKIYKASEAAFVGWNYRTRADIFDLYYKNAKSKGLETKGIGLLANSLTGRGSLGRFEPGADLVNVALFSPRFMMSNLEILTNPLRLLGRNPETAYARRQAALNSLRTIGTMATTVLLVRALAPNLMEEDPTSADYGKLKFGHSRIDITGGLMSYYTLAMRIATGKRKSSTTQIVNDVRISNLIGDFMEGKTSPAVRTLIIDWAKGETFEGNKPTLLSSAQKLVTPIGASTIKDLVEDKSNITPVKAAIYLADALGFGANTYSASVEWETSESKTLKQFREKIGDSGFNKANDEFNKQYSQRVDEIVNNEKYKSLSNEDKKRVINREKSAILKKIFYQYKFHPKEEKKSHLPKI